MRVLEQTGNNVVVIEGHIISTDVSAQNEGVCKQIDNL